MERLDCQRNCYVTSCSHLSDASDWRERWITKHVYRSPLISYLRIQECIPLLMDKLKQNNHGKCKKSPLVSQNHEDYKACHITTKLPTVQRVSQTLLFRFPSSLQDMKTFSRDITQAYIHSHSCLEKVLYITPPSQPQLQPEAIFKVVHPLYGFRASGLHWYLTYSYHHEINVRAIRSSSDPYVLVGRSASILEAMVILQLDDGLGIGTEYFLIF